MYSQVFFAIYQNIHILIEIHPHFCVNNFVWTEWAVISIIKSTKEVVI